MIPGFGYGFHDPLRCTDHQLSDDEIILELFTTVQEYFNLIDCPVGYEADSLETGGHGDITIVRDDGEAPYDPRDLAPGPWILLDNELARRWPTFGSLTRIESTGMDTSMLNRLWEDDTRPVILPGRTLAPMVYDGRQCAFKDLQDRTAAVAEYVGVHNMRCPDQQVYNDTQTDSILALQHHLQQLGKMAVWLALADDRRPHQRKTNYLEMPSPLTLKRFKTTLLIMFAEITKKYTNVRTQLRLERMAADLERDTLRMADAAKRRRMLNQNIFEEAADRVAVDMSVPLLVHQEQCIVELETLYALFEAQRTLLMQEDIDIPQGLDKYMASQKCLCQYAYAHNSTFDEQIDSLQDALGACESLAMKVTTRVRRISAADATNEDTRWSIAKDRMDSTGLDMLVATLQEFQLMEALHRRSKDDVTAIEKSLRILTGLVLDNYVVLQDLYVFLRDRP